MINEIQINPPIATCQNLALRINYIFGLYGKGIELERMVYNRDLGNT